MCYCMRGSRIFRQKGGWGPGPYVVFVLFFSAQLILQKSSGLFRQNYTFLGVPEVSYCIFPIEPDITCDFPGGS